MDPKIFFETHAKSAKSISKIFKYTKCRVEVFVNLTSRSKDKITYFRVKLGSRKSSAILFNKISGYFLGEAKKMGIELEI